MRTLYVLICLISISFSTTAATYEVSVTRKDSNLYVIDGKNTLIHTRYCYTYAYSEDAYLRTEGYSDKLIFIDSKDSCDVQRILEPVNLNTGTYEVQVSREDDKLYNIFGTDNFIITSMCLNLALADNAILKITFGSSGTLTFDDGDSCQVEGVYGKMNL
ncbi:hypothetical protein [Yersinia frederiksenii]|uniref:hypothetical protein n=1 Tax=Yersinia frederiksenii TaxID=29484 RepID=UPI0011A9D5EE|nr:hypothetical protein [Yersinia frederiksenii]